MAFQAPELIGQAEPLIVVYDLGGTRCRAAVGGSQINDIEYFDTPKDPETSLETAATKLAGLTATMLDGRKPDFLGCAVAGEVAPDGSSILRAGPLQEYGWTKQPVRSVLASAIGMGPENVQLINDTESAGHAQRFADRNQPYLLAGQGYIETISSGNGGAVFSQTGAENVEPGHIDSGRPAPVTCGCGGLNCVEAWISGNSVAKAWEARMEDVPYEDSRWDDYQDTFLEMQRIKLDALRDRGFDPQSWFLFGSVALRGPRDVLGDFAVQLANDEQRAMPVTAASYRDESGLYGAYFATRELALTS